MKEELQAKLVDIIDAIQATAGKAGDFAMTQLPEIAQQYVVYGRVVSTTFFILGLILTAASLWVFLRLGLLNKEAVNKRRGSVFEGDWLPERLIATFAGGVGIVMGVMLTAAQGMAAALVWFAPKVWLLKTLVSLVK